MLKKYSWLSRDILEKDYKELGNFKLIAEKYNIPRSTIERYCKTFKLKTIPKIRYDVNHNFFSTDSEETFYVAGFIAADGCILQHKNKEPNCITICLSKKDENFLVLIKNMLKFNGPITYIINNLSKYNDNWNNCEQARFTIYSKQVINDLKRFGIGQRKSLNYEIPDDIINHPLKHHFIRGYIDGDGSFYYTNEKWLSKKSNTFKYCRKLHCSIRGTEKFLNQIKNIINNNIKYSSKTTPHFSNGIFQLCFSGEPLVGEVVKFMYHDASIFMDRKYDIVKGLL